MEKEKRIYVFADFLEFDNKNPEILNILKNVSK